MHWLRDGQRGRELCCIEIMVRYMEGRRWVRGGYGRHYTESLGGDMGMVMGNMATQ